jgi:hypothetical protein
MTESGSVTPAIWIPGPRDLLACRTGQFSGKQLIPEEVSHFDLHLGTHASLVCLYRDKITLRNEERIVP